jgi:site-specific recombinase XerD
MALNIRYFVKTTKKTNEVNLRLRFKNGRKIDLSSQSGFTINPEFWNNEKNAVRNMAGFKNSKEFQTKVDKLTEHIKDEYRELNDYKEANKNWLNTVIDKFHHPDKYEENNKQLTFFEFIERFVNNSHKRLNSKGNLVGNHVKMDYKITKKYLEMFAKYKNKYYDFDEIDLDFYNEFIRFLRAEHKLATNTVGKHIKTLKTFLNDATEHGYNENLKYRSKQFKVFAEESESIYLNHKELETLYKFDLSDKPTIERVRDLFIVASYTGLRFSDLHKIEPEKINDNILFLKQSKTGDKTEIPIHPIVWEIIKKHNGTIPKRISNQKFNEYIKEAAKIAGLNATFTKTVNEEGQEREKTYVKYELISSHTARRSFCTNAYNDGVPVNIIRKISGHKTETAFLKYIKADEGESAKKMLEIWRSKV